MQESPPQKRGGDPPRQPPFLQAPGYPILQGSALASAGSPGRREQGRTWAQAEDVSEERPCLHLLSL